MKNGKDTTIVINPYGLDAITLIADRSGPNASEDYVYLFNAGGYTFNEERRVSWNYSRSQIGREGVNRVDGFVPIRIDVIIRAKTSDGRREAYRKLVQAATNRLGGTLKLTLDGAEGGVLDTYYHYMASPPPVLRQEPSNRFDADAVSEGFYRLRVQLELQTLPNATSDPDNPQTITALSTTLGNIGDWVTVPQAELQGSEPALTRLQFTPASGQGLGRVILSRRTSRDGTPTTLIEAEDGEVIYPSTAWQEVSDVNRSGGKYMRCTPTVNNYADGLRFTITTPTNADGRFAVFGVGYLDDDTITNWTHQVKLKSGNITQTGESYTARSYMSWHLIYAGEFELPLTDLSEVSTGYDEGPYLEWYSTQVSGSEDFRLDAVVLVWLTGKDNIEERAYDVLCRGEGGVVSPEVLLVENFPVESRGRDRAYVTKSNGDLVRTLEGAPAGKSLVLDPRFANNYLSAFNERAQFAPFQDDFSEYKARTWANLFSSEWGTAPSGWQAHRADYTSVTSSDRYRLIDNGGVGALSIDCFDLTWYESWAINDGLDIDMTVDGRFTDDDYVVLTVFIPKAYEDTAPPSDRLEFVRYVSIIFGSYLDPTDDEPPYVGDFFIKNISGDTNHSWVTYNVHSEGWHSFKIKRSDFSQTGDPNWSNITYVAIVFQEEQSLYFAKDRIFVASVRLEKADPDDTSIPNPTGREWDFQPSEKWWTLTEDSTFGSQALTCLSTGGHNLNVASVGRRFAEDVEIKTQVKLDENGSDGKVGIFWRGKASALTSGSEDFYTAFVDSNTQKVHFQVFQDGTSTELYSTVPSFAVQKGKWYNLGVLVKENQHKVYAELSSAVDYEIEGFPNEDALVILTTNAALSSGYAGFVHQGGRSRFTYAEVNSLEDQFLPDDQVTLTGKSVFQTIVPFD